MESLFHLLNHFHPISDGLRSDLISMVQEVRFEKGITILSAGEVCEHIYFMKKGFAKGSYLSKNKEITSWFWKENDLVTSMESFLKQAPTIEFIKTNEQCDMLQLSYTDLQELYEKHIEFNIIGRKIVEDYFLRAGEITTDLRNLSAKEKYEKFFHSYPEIFQRTSLESIASFLGITQETLSRIRGSY